MSLGLPGRHERPVDPGDALTARAAALGDALALGGDLLDPDAAGEAREVAGRVGERMALGGRNVVVALAGSTGSGKSSIFNALVGEDVAEVGVRRPMTSVPRAAVWDDDPASALLDWLGVDRRHRVAGAHDDLRGLVLVDLPDFDSREAANRREADRLLGLTDLFVWVTDHQKYADAVIHDQYIAARRDHQANMLVVLNHADEVPAGDLPRVVADLTRLLEADGLSEPRVIATSARTGMGIDALRAAVAGVVADRKAALRRLEVDVDGAARRLREGIGQAPAGVSREARARLVSALARAAGVPTALDAVERSYRRDALRRTGVVFTRWRGSLVADPLKRLRLDRLPGGAPDPDDLRAALGRSSMPAPSAAARAELDLAEGELADAAAAGLPRAWADEVARAAHPPEPDVRDALDRALTSRVTRHRTPAWWSVASAVQWLCAAAVVAGVLWYVALGLAGWLQFALPDVPRWGPVPYPFLLIVGGLGLALLVSLACRAIVVPAARRRRRAVEASLREAVGGVADERIVRPVEAVLAGHRDVAAALARAAGA